MTATRVYATASVGLDGGLYRSTDAGASWSFTRLGVLDAVAIDPATPSTLYAVGDRGLLKSSDAGANWTSVQPEPSFCVAIAPSSPRRPPGASSSLFIRCCKKSRMSWFRARPASSRSRRHRCGHS